MRKSEVIEHFGGVSKTACVLGISHPAVCRWGEVIPQKQAFVIERITNGKLKYDASLYQKVTDSAA
ncbi:MULTISPECIES: Cro/CI family transcriptional regulator [Enterobacter]|uniref:Cro/CI family transcriptional regulator n=1 Tax=Enterobacter TaxID=547 RepID=UPI002DB61F6E|nr:Cro/CI family transcriptional regulator [Enterobacter vonholyi]MEB7622506.1 Cro/CI family transcriptional regulator [Enterobacter vonholyi]